MTAPDALLALRNIAHALERTGTRFAVVGGFAVSVRGEVRFTRDVDVAIAVRDDAEVEELIRELRTHGYSVAALVEHDAAKRLSTVRLRSPSGVAVDLLAASCGIEAEVVSRSTPVSIEEAGVVPMAQAEELVAMKVLSMEPRRLQDRIDAIRLVQMNTALDMDRVRANLRLIESRGFHRQQDLQAKLDEVLAAAKA